MIAAIDDRSVTSGLCGLLSKEVKKSLKLLLSSRRCKPNHEKGQGTISTML